MIKKREEVGIKQLNDSKAFVEYWQSKDDVYNNIDIIIQQEKEKT